VLAAVVKRRVRREIHDTLGECRFDLLLVGALKEEWDGKQSQRLNRWDVKCQKANKSVQIYASKQLQTRRLISISVPLSLSLFLPRAMGIYNIHKKKRRTKG
jgi:hypothetical protein